MRVDEHTRDTLARLAKETRQPVQRVLAEAVEQYRRRRIMEQTNAAYAALHADPESRDEEDEERELWDRALLDGLEDQ
jgi:predicted transcriptional regulator